MSHLAPLPCPASAASRGRAPRHGLRVVAAALLGAAAPAAAACGDGDEAPVTAEAAGAQLARGWRRVDPDGPRGALRDERRDEPRPLVLSLGRDGTLAGTVQQPGAEARGEPARVLRGGAWRLAEDGGRTLCLRFGAGEPERCAALRFESDGRMRWGDYVFEPFEVSHADLRALDSAAPAEATVPDTTAAAEPVEMTDVETTDASSIGDTAAIDDGERELATRADSLARCAEPGTWSQRTCLFAHISENDVELKRVFRELVAELRRRDGGDGDAEPPSVRALRDEEARWIRRRDRECREEGRGREGALWGAARAGCFRRYTDERTAELRMRLAELRTELRAARDARLLTDSKRNAILALPPRRAPRAAATTASHVHDRGG